MKRRQRAGAPRRWLSLGVLLVVAWYVGPLIGGASELPRSVKSAIGACLVLALYLIVRHR